MAHILCFLAASLRERIYHRDTEVTENVGLGHLTAKTRGLTTKGTKGTKGSDIYLLLNFVIFVSFVVKSL